jgi:nucleoside-specific outer membrane channel protein Tsx
MKKKIALVAMAAFAVCAQAADWSDTSIAYSTGTNFKEPYTAGGDTIAKNIFTLKNVSGDKYGQNFFAADMLQSGGNNDSAQEVYVAYRRLIDLQKVTGKSYAFGPVKNVGVTAGFDFNTKNDFYASKKRMLVAGPTLMMDVKQGFFDISILALNESNNPNVASRNSYSTGRYHYGNHIDLNFVWSVPTGINNLGFEGWADYIGYKGTMENGIGSSKETHIYSALMYDVSAPVGAAKNTFKLGAGYEYWKNKFGNDGSTVAGATAKTPFVKAEYHF